MAMTMVDLGVEGSSGRWRIWAWKAVAGEGDGGSWRGRQWRAVAVADLDSEGNGEQG